MARHWPILIPALIVAGCTAQADTTAKAPTTPVEKAVASAADRRAWFGELHLHTSYSFDAWGLMATKTTPDDAYRFGKGEAVSMNGQMIKRGWPLDFMAVTDHSENMGLLNALDDPESDLSKSAVGQEIRKDTSKSFYMLREANQQGRTIPGLDPVQALKTAWGKEVAAANANYKPGKFTTFIGYEWSQMTEGKYNLHRNVIFAGARSPAPWSSADSPKPEDLWTYLEKARADGMEAIAIPHNGNASNGLMYDWVTSEGRPIDEAYAERRLRNEPLTEIVQNKGQSETLPELSPNDEFANFEIYDVLITQRDVKGKVNGSYIRQAFGRGLVIQQKAGANPYKFGVVGGSDWHNGISASDENATAGTPGGIDPKVNLPSGDAAKKLLGIIQTRAMIDDAAAKAGRPPAVANPMINSSAGITGVWAEENTRESIFAALKRKETFATSGTRMKVRFFGGWGFAPGMTSRADWVRAAYRTGVPMGGDLPLRPAGAQAPSFIVQAVKDPDGANLDRVQIVKVWLEGSDYKEKIFEVALSGGRKVDPKTGRAAAVGNTVDLKTGAYKNAIGAATLQTVWRDPEFDPAKPAVYYLRALEIPTPRWTTLLAIKNGLPIPTKAPATIQERAYSSPIWFTPAGRQTAAAAHLKVAQR
ncbi:MAG: DUF3604 domain-containing protein [Alphaproteobacteria bacterium]|nr:DUF3604 domain-containing protein [Alphaproteobacteria bacterium]MBU1515265.1 DUF3604 domain-containing protein [Alphaproteobacteria bacterium]MBU2092395.1 DUF3604 domain-containing protein [Alphaproteobacteria bacterium]MBU2152989.1 DUF3604 domain-containing protein [Alphaproteobacteria bacterium]MBU2305820.1 DUF3604 domain-containing protein [Alphaproteobacteria bacterium]